MSGLLLLFHDFDISIYPVQKLEKIPEQIYDLLQLLLTLYVQNVWTWNDIHVLILLNTFFFEKAIKCLDEFANNKKKNIEINWMINCKHSIWIFEI